MTLPVVLVAYLAILTMPEMAGPTHAVEWITHPAPIVFISAASLVVICRRWLGRGVAQSQAAHLFFFCAAWSLLSLRAGAEPERALVAGRRPLSLCAVVRMEPGGGGRSGADCRGRLDRAQGRRRGDGRAAGGVRDIDDADRALLVRRRRLLRSDAWRSRPLIRLSPQAGRCDEQGGRPRRAAQELRVGTTLEPDDVHLHLKLAQQYKMMGRELDFEQEFLRFNQLSEARVEQSGPVSTP